MSQPISMQTPRTAQTSLTHTRHQSHGVPDQTFGYLSPFDSEPEYIKSNSRRHRHAPSMDSGSAPSAPDQTEVHRYYKGLHSRPILIARTDSTRRLWIRHADDLSVWSYQKFLAPVGDHSIVKLWQEGMDLPNKIVLTLCCFPWTAIDILRVGTWDQRLDKPPSVETLPVVMLITVAAGSTSWETAYFVASECKKCLLAFGITDVEVEVKGATRVPLASDSEASTTGTPRHDTEYSPRLHAADPSLFSSTALSDKNSPFAQLIQPLRHLSDHIGTRLACHGGSGTGTKGLYLKVAPTAPEIWPFEPCIAALTCQHVARTISDRGALYRWNGGHPSTRRVMEQNTGEDIASDSAKAINEAEVLHHRLQGYSYDNTSGVSNAAIDVLKIKSAVASERAEVAKRAQSILGQTHQGESAIEVGHVLFAQEYSTASSTSSISSPPTPESYSTGPWLRDYALVQMDETILGRELANRLPISSQSLYRKLLNLGIPLSEEFLQRSQDECAILSSQIVPESELMSFVGDRRIVAKFGANTELTFGVVNEVKSLTRNPMFNGIFHGLEVWEICVVHYESAISQIPFSRHSDSGAAVWDMDGRVLGMITSGEEGNKEKGGIDITYVTSIEKIIQDMKDSGITASLL